MPKLINQCVATALLTIVSVFCNGAYADLVIDVGNHTLLPNTAGQQIDILISSDPGDPLTSGLELRAEIGDGFGSGLEPVFSGVEGNLDALILSGTIYEGVIPGGEAPVMSAPSVAQASVVSSSDIVANGVLVSFLIDTTGFATPGASFNLNFANHATEGLPDTEVLGPIGAADPIPGVTINNGSINIAAVPEPAAASLVALGLLAMAIRRRRS